MTRTPDTPEILEQAERLAHRLLSGLEQEWTLDQVSPKQLVMTTAAVLLQDETGRPLGYGADLRLRQPRARQRPVVQVSELESRCGTWTLRVLPLIVLERRPLEPAFDHLGKLLGQLERLPDPQAARDLLGRLRRLDLHHQQPALYPLGLAGQPPQALLAYQAFSQIERQRNHPLRRRLGPSERSVPWLASVALEPDAAPGPLFPPAPTAQTERHLPPLP